ncbi:MAG: PqqD family protein [Proteobacteria bacterium]|nr:PqqD family protein [Pseudomonadota bacterium]
MPDNSPQADVSACGSSVVVGDHSAALHLRFAGLAAPILLDGCAEIIDTVARMAPGWPFTTAPADASLQPVATIRPDGHDRYLISTLGMPGKERRYDAVDAVCDLIVELSLELNRSGEWLMCLHAAAIEVAGRLVILPNIRRAGKSTLTACLAARGHRIFSDDFFPVSISAKGHLLGHATGILPRLRLPVPESFSAGFQDWVARNEGDGNHRYKYLSLPEVPAHGTALALGAMVFLDRREAAAPDLSPMATADAVAALLHQNFAREVHSGTVLATTEALFATVPAYRLSYGSAEAAAEFLEQRFADWPDEPAIHQDAPAFRRVDEADFTAPAAAFDPATAYVRADGIHDVELAGDRYLADASGQGIHRLNAGALAVWHLIAEPLTLDEICDILTEAFPEVSPIQIAADSAAALRDFVENRLAVAAG